MSATKKRLRKVKNTVGFRKLFFVGGLSFLFVLTPFSSALAEEDRSISLRAGLIKVETKEVSGNVQFGGVDLPGAELTVDDLTQEGIFFNWRFSRHFSLETIISTPMEFDVNAGGGPLGPTFKAAEIKVMPLALLLRYDPSWEWKGFRPFLGIGATYVYFIKDPHTTAEFDALAASLGAVDPEANVARQWDTIFEAGLDYNINNRLFANATVLYFSGDTSLVTVFADNKSLSSSVEYAPYFFAMTLGYRF